MRILLTNRSLGHYWGTETWTREMAKELSKEHDVTVLTCELGKVSNEIKNFAKVVTFYDGDYDFAIVNHIDTFLRLPAELPKIFTSHSAFLECESFPEGCIKIGVTEETAKGNRVIRNGFDLDHFKPTKVNKELKTILYLCNPIYQGGQEIMKEACGDDYELLLIERETSDVKPLIDKADLVVGFGRGLMEAMCSGKNVLSADWRITYMDGMCGAGMVTEDNFGELKLTNFTGRPDQIRFTPETLREEFKKYDPTRSLRKRMEDEFDIKKNAQEYINLYKNEYNIS